MTPRENLLSLYRREGYRHAPVHLQLCPSLQAHFRELAGDRSLADYFDYPEGFAARSLPGLKLKPRESVDWSRYYTTPHKAGTTYNEYGVAHEPGSGAAHHMTRMHHPLAAVETLAELERYPFPEYETDIAHMRAAAEALHADGRAAVGHMACTIWETAWYMRDMTRLMMDMLEGDEKATYLLDRVTADAVQRATAYARAGADIIETGDDVGMQQAIMMSRDLYREWLQPRLARVIAAAKRENPDILVHYHSCGYVEPLIGDLVEAGVDILNPVQPECMDFATLHRIWGDRLSFNGTLGTQRTMPFGTADEVRATVVHHLDIAGPRGGLLCCPTHLLEPEVPWANIEAYVRACKDYRPA